MDYLRFRSIFGDLARNPVIETHADGYQQVAFLGHHIGGDIAVHSDHTYIVREV